MSLAEINEDMGKLLDKFSKSGEKLAEADAAEKYGENMISVVRARIETEFMDKGKSASESEKRAKASSEYEEYLQEYKKIRLNKMKAQAEHEDNRNRIMFKMSMNKAVMEEMKFTR